MKLQERRSLRILTVPGLYGSGPTHWQSRWEQLYGYIRVGQDNWSNPQFDQWSLRLKTLIANNPYMESVVLVAHSLGCYLVVKSLPFLQNRVRALFLVAPPDLNCSVIKKDLSSFHLQPVKEITIPGLLIYSENDPFASAQWSDNFGKLLGVPGISVGNRGHINSESNIGDWPEGAELLNRLID